MSRNFSFLLLILIVFAIGTAFAQDTKDDVKLFQSFFFDTPITKVPYGEAGLDYANSEGGSAMNIMAKGGYGINPNLEINGQVGFLKTSPDEGDGESGLSDLFVSARYMLPTKSVKAAVGGFITLPIGKEELGQGQLNFGGFGALRHPLNNGMIITATAALLFRETKDYNKKTGEVEDTYESSIRLAGGAIYPVNPQLNVVGELALETEGDYMMLSGGGDYKLSPTSRVRGGLGLGLDDGAPDFLLMVSYQMNF